VLNFCTTSLNAADGNLQANSAFLAFQSRLFTWSDKIAPLTSNPSGILISKGYPLTWLVMGQRMAKPTFPLYAIGDKTNAGRCPVCSCPACGLNIIQTMSPLSGIYAIVLPNFISYGKASINFVMEIIFVDTC